jgi:hypothetical protein
MRRCPYSPSRASRPSGRKYGVPLNAGAARRSDSNDRRWLRGSKLWSRAAKRAKAEGAHDAPGRMRGASTRTARRCCWRGPSRPPLEEPAAAGRPANPGPSERKLRRQCVESLTPARPARPAQLALIGELRLPPTPPIRHGRAQGASEGKERSKKRRATGLRRLSKMTRQTKWQETWPLSF